MNYKFSNYMEFADFGLDITKMPKKESPTEKYDTPIERLNIGYIIKSLKNHTFGEKTSIVNDFFGELQWGRSDGDLKLEFSPYGGTKAALRKLIHDQEGHPTWICKKVIEVNNFFDQKADSLTFLLQDSLNEVDSEGLDAPSSDFQGFQRLVLNMASILRRRTTQKIFIYEGIRMIKENEKYLIHFGVTGYGRQKAQRRLDQFAIHCTYDPKPGTILITGTELGDRIEKHRWIYSPSMFMEYFVPSQKEDEITKAVLTLLNCY